MDDIILFNSLDAEQIKEIVGIQLGILQKRLENRRLHLEITDHAREHLSATGFDPVYGARPLKRAIQREIENQLAMKLIDGTFQDGDSIRADTDPEGRIVFERLAEPETVAAAG